MQSPGIIQIGDDNVLREFVTVHMPMEALTWIGNSCYIMAYNHFPHDVFVEDDVNMTNNCQIAGYSTIMHHVNLGLSSVAHQHSVIGAGAMIGMASVIVKDVPPYVVFINGVATRVNQVGLERMGKSEDEIRDLFQWYSGQRHNKLELADDLSSRWWYKDMKRFIELTKREMCPIGFAG
jgi:UDP-N-acetylglucosamine acyltransferase